MSFIYAYVAPELAAIPAILSIADTYSEHGFMEALHETSWVALYMAAPVALYAANPYLGLAYTAGITSVAAYEAISNAYSLLQGESNSLPGVE